MRQRETEVRTCKQEREREEILPTQDRERNERQSMRRRDG